MSKQRLQKHIAEAGVASRREADAWISEGRVTVNGVLAVPGTLVGPDDRISIDGRPLRVASGQKEPLRVLLYKKRVGEVVSRSDPEGRRTVFRKLPKLRSGRWISIGRLDINTSGLLLFTNDGDLAHRLMHPGSGLARQYAVRVHGPVDEALCRRLLSGVALDDGPASFDALQAVGAPAGEMAAANQWFEVTVHEGRNRLVRRLWESQGCEVARLIRVGFGPIRLGRGIRSAGYREADPAEVNALLQAVGLPPQKNARPAPAARAPASASRPARRPPAGPRRRG